MNMEVQPAPHPKEVMSKPDKLLSEATTGAQALLLLGLEPPKPGTPAPAVQKEQLIKNAAEGIPVDHKKRLITASFNERDEFWKDTPETERMEKWCQKVNTFLDQYTKNKSKTTEQAFLKAILKRDNLNEITADTLYSTFMQGEGKGDIEFFARRIVDTNSVEKIGENQELIKSLGNIYGSNSTKIGTLLTCGIANARHNSAKFAASAQENLNKRAFDEDVWTPLAKSAANWDGKQQAMQQPEQPGTAKEYHPFVADAGTASEASAGKKANQDAHFSDPKHGAFGVFDGVGSLNKSGEVADAAATHVAEALAQIERGQPLSLDETEKRIRKAITDTSEKMSKREDIRYKEVVEDIKKIAAGALSDDDFAGKYEGSKRQGTISQWIRRQYDPAKPDEINENLKGWINRQIRGSTTASVVKLWQGPNGERKAIIANAGDSRVYHYTARDGALRIVTVDNNSLYDVVGEAKAREYQDAKSSDRKWKKDTLGAEKILLKQSNPQHLAIWQEVITRTSGFNSKYPWGANGEVEIPLTEIDDFGITKTIPRAHLEPNIHTVDFEPHDKLIITSDGVHDELLTAEIKDTLDNPDNRGADKAARALVAFAKKGELVPNVSGGTLKDDTTAVVIDLK